MAATRLIVLHENKGKTILQALKDRIDYAQNPEKTEKGELISSYECDPKTAAEEFLLSKRNYEQKTGKRNNVLGYQIRQSFLPGEITPEEANQVGYELAMHFTKGRHAFTVSTHTDKAHIHNHIIYNAVTLDEERKFRDFRRSNMALHRVSDRICLEHGLSIIDPGRKEMEKICGDLEKRSSKNKIQSQMQEPELSLLIDIQEKLQQGKGKGYEIWAKKFNLKQMAQVMCFLEENGIGSYEELVKTKHESSRKFEEIKSKIKSVEGKMVDVSALRTHIFNYSKTKKVYDMYRQSGWDKQFYEEHREQITLHYAAKEAFEKQKMKKLPTVKMLNEEFAKLASEKKSLYAEYRDTKKKNRELLIAEKNVATILGVETKNEKDERSEQRKNANRNDPAR